MFGFAHRANRWLFGLLVLLVVTAAYLYPFPQPNVIYAGVVLVHVLGGIAASLLLFILLPRRLKSAGWMERVAWLLLVAAAILGLVLTYTGASRPYASLLHAHIVLTLIAASLLVAAWMDHRGYGAQLPAANVIRPAVVLIVLAAVGYGAWYARNVRWQQSARIENPLDAPASMDQEGDGPKGPFFPSSAQVAGGGKIPSKFFMESDSCRRCHNDIYQQWFSSVHHFSSFNNQWYRKSIEYMQDVVGTRPSKWCGGCHDPAVLYSGMMDTPIRQIVHTPEAQAGLGCMMCHSIARVKSTMGQGDFYLEYPKLHELAATKNPLARRLHDFLIYLNPEPHRRVFLKPFMRAQTAEFCSTCHKVHLDVPVNHYRWIRGFNEYDNWQASGVSGQGARSFYYPPKPAQCADCHMPLTASKDAGSINGFIHSHRFPAANTAVPVANEDAVQLKATEDFLKNGVMSIDIFALSEARGESAGVHAGPELATTFAVGEEAEHSAPTMPGSGVTGVTAPLNRVHALVRRGDSTRVEVVVRTRKLGHFFPGGTVDAYDTWVELKATDDAGRVLFWSGSVEDGGKGPVEPGAHFYRSLQIDGHGNPINKRNAWATRSVVYVHLIPPGAADTVHYRLRIPENAGSRITLHARLSYRKFAWWNTQFAFAGTPSGSASVTPDHDDRGYDVSGPARDVSATHQRVPEVPIVSLAEDEVTVAVLPRSAPRPRPHVAIQADDWQRWNDYGIGLLAQGDLKGAEAAFENVTRAQPDNPDGWVNIGRAAVQEGDLGRAAQVLTHALALSPNLARAHFFYAEVLRNQGRYDEAAQQLRTVLAQYPRDRVALNNLGRVLFLQRRYADAVRSLQLVLAIDPEDLQAHYNLMLCYNGLSDEKRAQEQRALYLRFKADESAQTLTGPYRSAHPDDNNERQAIHEHVSAALPAANHGSAGAAR